MTQTLKQPKTNTMSPEALITALKNPDAYPHPVSYFKILETHLSWVILTGKIAYKIKKPVNFGFVDYTTLEKRHFFCKQEIVYNQFLAPAIDDAVVTICDTNKGPVINGDGPVIEYAIKMKEFAQEDLLDKVVARDELTSDIITEIAHQIAAFHAQTDVATASKPFGTLDAVSAPVQENFEQAGGFLTEKTDILALEALRTQIQTQTKALEQTFIARKNRGLVRACHGDLHLGNITLIEGKPVIFDCIEFNENFRWTDVMAEIGFLVMDLCYRNQPGLAACFLSAYLERTGDYAGLSVLNYYISYRAMVRAKIQLFEAQAPALSSQAIQTYWDKYRHYCKLATSIIEPKAPTLFMLHGVSGSGKSTVALMTIRAFQAVRICSDIERKRLFATGDKETAAEFSQGIYTKTHSDKTYQHLNTLARTALLAGFSVTIDASFLNKSHRDATYALCAQLKIPCVLLSCQADKESLLSRLSTREKTTSHISDANAEILKIQLHTLDPLSAEETQQSVCIDTNKPLVTKTLIQDISKQRGTQKNS